ncbi:hypothetical protein M9H77_18305 [Catharanthus roseus]|uniref:Uncharacterized protein n=1 Tax=Catharanthus roseus TaxID=4058 RepID=A0ACC0B793_CATRO|nr:hypothetical protein M9H77_18305 [Catharanthus roseus]
MWVKELRTHGWLYFRPEELCIYFDQYVERIALYVASPPHEGLFQTICLAEGHVLVPPACILAICFCNSSAKSYADGPAGTEIDIEDDPSEPTTGSSMDTAEWLKDILTTKTSKEPSIEPTSFIPASPTKSKIATLQMELGRTSRHFYLSRQARQLEPARVDRLATELAQMRGTFEAQHHSMSQQCWLRTTSRSANEIPTEANARRRGFSIHFPRQGSNLGRTFYKLDSSFDIPFDYGMLHVNYICKLKEFKQEYIPRWIRERCEDEFQQLKQEGMIVAQYIAKFNCLAKYFEAATRIKIADQVGKQRVMATVAPSQSHKRPGQGC